MKIEYDGAMLEFEANYPMEVRGMQAAPAPLNMPEAVANALANPIASESLLDIAREKLRKNVKSKAIIVISDNTRPVPYYGRQGLIFQIINVLHEAGFSLEQITILIGAGSHRNMEKDEIDSMIGLNAMGLGQVRVINHEYDEDSQLYHLGHTRAGSQVDINRAYYESDLKIVTGLVESHFMAGASGGRKGICPAIVGKRTLTLFHGAKFLSSHRAVDLILDGNPLHEESCEIALMAGCDFLVNVTIDNERRVTGVFAGDLLAAHREAVAKIREYVSVPIPHSYDIVVIPAGFVGINHYQAAKAAIEAARAVKTGGKIIVVAKNTDPDPIGGDGYKKALKLLAREGANQFMEIISDHNWQIIQEQWQVQMWCKVLEVIKEESNLYYCALEIPSSGYDDLPGIAGIKLLNANETKLPANEAMKLMIEKCLAHAIQTAKSDNPKILLLKDGPYGIPVID